MERRKGEGEYGGQEENKYEQEERRRRVVVDSWRGDEKKV